MDQLFCVLEFPSLDLASHARGHEVTIFRKIDYVSDVVFVITEAFLLKDKLSIKGVDSKVLLGPSEDYVL